MDIEKIIESFHFMWDTFPERARLIDQHKNVLAVNKAGETLGMETGVRCCDAPPVELHRGCLANLALREHKGEYSLTADKKRLRFWLPVAECDDLYVHFSIPMTELL